MRVLLRNSGPGTAFGDVLDAAAQAAGVAYDDLRTGHSARALRGAASSHLQQLGDAVKESRQSMLRASIESYLEQLGETRTPRRRRPADVDAIADELAIGAHMSMADLNRLRREFALANHPDRTDSSERENATRRMMIANMLIDRALKLRSSQRSSKT